MIDRKSFCNVSQLFAVMMGKPPVTQKVLQGSSIGYLHINKIRMMSSLSGTTREITSLDLYIWSVANNNNSKTCFDESYLGPHCHQLHWSSPKYWVESREYDGNHGNQVVYHTLSPQHWTWHLFFIPNLISIYYSSRPESCGRGVVIMIDTSMYQQMLWELQLKMGS